MTIRSSLNISLLDIISVAVILCVMVMAAVILGGVVTYMVGSFVAGMREPRPLGWTGSEAQLLAAQ